MASLGSAWDLRKPKPDREFTSVDEFNRFNQNFAEIYFTGRIAEKDHDLAEITIEFELNGKKYSVTRGLFEVNRLRSLSIIPSHNQIAETYEYMSPQELNNEYINKMVRDIGVESFDQFVFLQLFVFTFDERRELIFWNNKVLEQALYLAFGINYAEAKKADTLRRESERADSLARNFNWQANEVRKQINNLKNETVTIPEEIPIEFEELKKLQSEQQEKVVFLQNSLENYNTQLLRASSQFALLRNQYEQAFQSHLYMTQAPLHHPLLVQTIQSGICGICGTENVSATAIIRNKVDHRECPLCGTHFNNVVQPPNIDQLRDLDTNIEKTRVETEEYTNAINRMSAELKDARARMDEINDKVNEFEFANQSILVKLQNKRTLEDGVAVIQASYKQQMEELLRKKEEAYKRRDRNRTELAKLQKDLEGSYTEAEIHFVPLFKELAFKFLGIDLDITIRTTYPNPNVTLVLEVEGSERRQQFQLSESQKFFVDIALRMALASYMSTEASKATLYIDTPEGSLDIAYESRAGEMFAIFIKNDHDIIMTANINSSRLVRQLAARCGVQKMQIVRMTQWTVLSEVQIQEEKLFEAAYQEIEASLHEGMPIDRL